MWIKHVFIHIFSKFTYYVHKIPCKSTKFIEDTKNPFKILLLVVVIAIKEENLNRFFVHYFKTMLNMKFLERFCGFKLFFVILRNVKHCVPF